MLTPPQAGTRWDVIVVGAGHNGLTAGALLARAGLSTLVLERRDVVGRCCVTEEIAPGCRASTTSYIASMLRPEVIRELDLGSHGMRMVPCEPALQIPAFGRGGGGDLDWDSGIAHRDGTYTFTLTGPTRRAPFPGLGESDRARHRGELILPNLMLSLSADHVTAFTVWPHDAGHTTVLCDFLFHPDEIARDDFDPTDAVEFWDLVNRQDWSVCEQVQDGMSSRMFTAGYLAPMAQPSADVSRYVTSRLGAQRPRARAD